MKWEKMQNEMLFIKYDWQILEDIIENSDFCSKYEIFKVLSNKLFNDLIRKFFRYYDYLKKSKKYNERQHVLINKNFIKCGEIEKFRNFRNKVFIHLDEKDIHNSLGPKWSEFKILLNHLVELHNDIERIKIKNKEVNSIQQYDKIFGIGMDVIKISIHRLKIAEKVIEESKNKSCEEFIEFNKKYIIH